MRSVSTDSAHVPHEGKVSNTNVTPKRTESEVVPHVGKSILAPASRLTPVTLSLAPMRVNKPQETFDLMNTKLADGPNVSTATIVVDSAGRLGPALNFDTNTRQVQKSHNQHFPVTGPFANVDKRIDPSFDDVNGNDSLSKKLESPKPHQDLSPQPANGWKDLVIGVREEERETFVRPLSPQTTPDDEPIELD